MVIMTRRIAGQIPLAFILAMAAEASSSATAEATNSSIPLEPGALSGLLRGSPPDAQAQPTFGQHWRQGNAGTKVVQFFPNFPNFRNCFAGAWRNC
jgi:hypothetical protein